MVLKVKSRKATTTMGKFIRAPLPPERRVHIVPMNMSTEKPAVNI
jgi:hypothetical protein